MNPWEFLLAVCSGYLGLVVGFYIFDRIIEGRARDRRVKLWTEMVLRKQRTKKGWESQTMRDED